MRVPLTEEHRLYEALHYKLGPISYESRWDTTANHKGLVRYVVPQLLLDT